ncbi:hypothetical protein [Oceanisphaera litoralis]|uniref:hypothetical protein n=1 Tax=Oceanisphaera litoralis TaxID=225144 RepID=UPI001956191D
MVKVVDTLATQPGKSITAACRGWSERQRTTPGKGDGEPGLQTLWLGLERCHDMVCAIQETKELLG